MPTCCEGAKRRARQRLLAAGSTLAAAGIASTAQAQHATDGPAMAPNPPPVGVNLAHALPAGKLVTMYTRGFMHLEGLKIGREEVTPEQVVTTVPNRFFGLPEQPPTLRIVPLKANMQTQMMGAVYGLADGISLFVAGSYVDKTQELLTFKGPAGTTRLGTATQHTEGFGDTRAGAVLRLYQAPGVNLTGILGLTIPTGALDEIAFPLTPMGMRVARRANYGLQLGTGTYDGLLGLTYMGQSGPLGWGAAYRGRIPLESENDEGYRWSDQHVLTGWLSYAFTQGLSGTARLEGSTQDPIEGIDPKIIGPARGANPDFYGGERIEAFLGLNATTMLAGIGAARVGIEAGTPLYENVEGPQLSKEWSLQFTGAIRF